MIARLNRRSLLIGVPGFVLQHIGVWLLMDRYGPNTLALLAMVFLFAGTLMFLIGLAYYAKAKGQSGAWGLLGFLSFIGWIWLALLPDRGREGR